MANPPIKKARLKDAQKGTLTLDMALWKTKDGGLFASYELTKGRKQLDGTWKNTPSFTYDDKPAIGRLFEQGKKWEEEAKAEAKGEKPKASTQEEISFEEDAIPGFSDDKFEVPF